MKIIKFEDLEIWQRAIVAVKEIYKLTRNEKFSRDFGLRDQIQRAVVSISSNIVEGFEKNNNNEFIRFLKIAKGSCGEVRSQLYIAVNLKYINVQEFDKTSEILVSLSNGMGKLISYLEEKRRNNNSQSVHSQTR